MPILADLPAACISCFKFASAREADPKLLRAFGLGRVALCESRSLDCYPLLEPHGRFDPLHAVLLV